MIRKVEHAGSVVFIFSIISILFLGIYWGIYDDKIPDKIVHYHLSPHDGTGTSRKTLENKSTFKVGEFMFTWVEWCTNSNKKGKVKRSFVNAFVFQLPTISIQTKIGCYKQSFGIQIPNLPPGKYFYKVVTSYKINPLIGWREMSRPLIPFNVAITPKYHYFPSQIEKKNRGPR